jgi:TolB-like protein/class 3 adenylate cyclase
VNNEDIKRKLSAILSADVKEYSRLMSQDERGTIRTLSAYKEAMSGLIQAYKGRVVDSPGDNLLAEFGSVVDAVNCAVEVQRELAERNADLPPARQMEFRIGINLGDVVEEEGRIYGDGVNIAARVEGLAEGGGICISGTVYDQVKNKLGLEYEYLGEQSVKNIPEPVRVYRVLSFPGAAAHRVVKAKSAVGRTWRNVVLGIAAVFVVGAAAAIWNFYIRSAGPPAEVASVEKKATPLEDKLSLAVLPFVNMSDDPKQEYFSDGITEDLITDLSKIAGIFVIARNSTFTYKGKAVKIRQVAEELGVRYVLEGSVRKVGELVRINAQLIDSTSGHHLWAERYDGNMGDVFTLQDEITRKIVTALAVKLTVSEKEKVAIKGTKNIAAYDTFLKGWEHYLRETPDDFAKAISYFKKAIELDPNYGRAYAALAMISWRSADLGMQWTLKSNLWWMDRLRARKYLEMAMKDPTSIAHQVASLMALRRREHEKAIAEAERAIAIDPSDPGCHRTLASAFIFGGRSEEAIDTLKKVMVLDPRNLAGPLYFLGLAHFTMGELEEAATLIDRALRHNPERRRMAGVLAAAYGHLDRDGDARAALDNFLKGFGGTYRLPDLMDLWPFKDPEVAERLAQGFIKAGLPGQSSEYYKLYKEYKLSGKEIRDLVFGRTVTGIESVWGQQWWLERTQDGKAAYRNPVGSENGTSWIEGDTLCNQWQTFYEGLKYCFPVFRNPEGTPERKNEYFGITDLWIISFSPVD